MIPAIGSTLALPHVLSQAGMLQSQLQLMLGM